jgi:hypothetical protein
MGSLVFMPLGLALAGPAAGVIGVPATLIGGGVFCGLATFALVAVPDVRGIRRSDIAPAPPAASAADPADDVTCRTPVRLPPVSVD